MAKLKIDDLTIDETLDAAAMNRVHGGFLTRLRAREQPGDSYFIAGAFGAIPNTKTKTKTKDKIVCYMELCTI